MLSRAALRSVRATAFRPAPVSLSVRGFAKDNRFKHKKPLNFNNQPFNQSTPEIKTPSSASVSDSQTPNSVPSPSSSRTTRLSNDVDYSNQQAEFQASAAPSENAAPQSIDASSSIKDTLEPSRTEYSSQQNEFQTSAAPEENTAPQSTSPSVIDPAEMQKEEQSLPDLRQGLPSTIEYELSSAASKARGAKVSILNLTEDPSAEGGGGGMGGAPASSYVSSADRKRQKLTNWAVMGVLGMILISPVYLGRNWETEEEEQGHPDAPSGWGLKLFFQRMMARTNDWMGYYTEPAFQKLLPDIEPAYAREYTLVLNLEDLLLHNEWTREHGWRLAKRPGLDYFLRYLSQYYELVIWTTQPFSIAEVVVTKLDPYHLAQPLFREATVYSKGEHIKDLSYLNRDPSKVIVLETNPTSIQRQPENAIVVKKFEGDANDKELVSLIPFLEYIPAMQTKDVRDVIKAFEGTHIPTEYAKREAIQRKRFEARLAEERKKHPKSGLGWGAKALGIKPQPTFEGEITFAEALAQGKMIQDIYRERGQREYERFDKLIRTEGPKWLEEETAMQKKMQEEMMKTMNPLTKFGLGQAPSPPKSEEGSSQADSK